MNPLSSAGYVYFAGHESIGPIKIGASADPYQRVRELRTGSPIWISILGTLPVENMVREERRLHLRFDSIRSHGEWFERVPELLTLILTCKPAAREARPPEAPPEGIHTLMEASEILGYSISSLRKRVQRKADRIPVQGQRKGAFLYRIQDLI